MAAPRCPRCDATAAPGQRFCGACGASLARACPNCSHENPAGFRFCSECGSSLDQEPAVSAKPQSEERRWATVVFADLSGFTSLSERTDPEDVRGLVDRCMNQLGAVADRYEGVVDSVSGDQIMVVFGAPFAHEDDADRAVRCALEMIRCAEENAEEFGGLPLRIGVNTGEMMFAPVGPASARQHTILGDAVNVGARLQAAAPRSGVLVGEETYRASRHAISYEGPIEVLAKGKDEPVRAWRAIAVIAAPAERPVSGAPMVGRDPVLGQLHSLWKRVVNERRPHLVTVLGPPGIGKSRLSQELATLVEEAGGRVVRGRSQPYGELLGYGSFAQQVKMAAGIRDSDLPEDARARLTSFVHVLGMEGADEVSDQLAVMIGLGEEAAGDRQALFHGARRFVEALAATMPTLFVFEDIHWADRTLLDLISSLAARIREAPVMLLTLSRPDLLTQTPSWGGGLESYTALPLAPLTDVEANALVARLAPDLEPALAAQLVEASDGNPLFIEELASSAAEGRLGAQIPTSIKSLIAARIDTLPADERALILDASVLGKVFWRGALERLSGGPVAETLDRLEARDLVRRGPLSRIEGDEEYTFKHIMIREVAYATLPRATRRARHEEAARFFEEATGERIAEHATTLAYHWREADDTDRAIEYLLMAAEKAGRAWAKSEAVQLYAEALSLLDEQDPRTPRLRLMRASMMVEAGDLPGAAAELDLVLPMLQGRDRLEALLSRGRAAYWMVNMDVGLRVTREAEALAEEIGDIELLSATRSLSVEVATMTGQLERAVELADEALASWPPGARPATRAVVQAMRGVSSYWLGRHDQAYAHNMDAYSEGLALQNVEATLTGGAQVGMTLTGMGRHEEAVTFLQRVIAHGQELELVPRLTSRAANALACALGEMGDIDGARAMNEQAIEMASSASFINGIVQGRIDLLFWDLLTGHLPEAERALPDLFGEAEKLRGWHEWLVVGRLGAAESELLLALGKADDAVDAAQRAIDRSAEVGRLKYQVRSQGTLGRALLASGRAADGVAVLRAALAGAERLGHPHTLWAVASSLSSALEQTGDDTGAEEALRRARQVQDVFVATLEPHHRETFLKRSALSI